MDIKLNLDLKQTQKLIMSQNLQLSLQLLQVSTLELQELIEKELLENPMLEQVEDEPEKEMTQEEEDWEKSEKEAEEWIDTFEDNYHAADELEYDPNKNDFEYQLPEPPQTLAEFLIEQLIMIDLTESERQIAEFFIDSLNDDGYFELDMNEVTKILNISTAKAYQTLKLIQSLDPAGIGARDLKECLLIQLNRRYPNAELAIAIVRDHLNNFLERKLNIIAKFLNVLMHDIQQASDIISTLDPKPGRRFGRDYPEDVIPDLIVHQVGDEFFVLYNDRSLPSVRINFAYRELIKKKGDKEARKFVVDKLNAAKFLVKAIDQRRDTMIKVMQSIVNHQEEFFRQGLSKLKPLTFSQVAEDVERHESTVSRVVANKYVQTPRGTYELKFFFSGGIITSDGGETSSRTVKNTIQEIVANEDHTNPLSDDQIVDLLAEKGIQVARRTIAKYRQQLGILPRRLRKQYA